MNFDLQSEQPPLYSSLPLIHFYSSIYSKLSHSATALQHYAVPPYMCTDN